MRNIYGKYMHYPDFFADFDYLFNKSIGKPYDKGLTHYLSSKRYETLARLIKEYDNRFFYLKAYNVANPIRTYGLNTRQLWFFNAFIKRYMLTLRNKSSLIGLTNVAYWKVLKGADYSREYSIIEPLLLEKIEDIYADFYYRE